jgi:prepilin-type N-terminal cleavage/methylation domain-containing protein
MSRQRNAFTLVELLVVIGIIGVLISILLPSLNRARQAANFVDCQSRLRQMGLAVQTYTSNNKGLLPWGGIMHTAAFTDNTLPNASNQEQFWWWHYTLSEIMNKNLMGSDGLVRNLSPVFRDTDTIEPAVTPRWVSHYTANIRVLYRADNYDRAPAIFSGGQSDAIEAGFLQQRKVTSIRRPSDVFMIWDGPQTEEFQSNTYGLAEAIDAWGYDNTSALILNPPSSGFVMNRPILPGQLGVTGRQSGKEFQRKYNIDPKNAFNPGGWLSHLRFRHMKNQMLAALCVDGHVEQRRVGEVMVKDIFTNYK